jgi:hypothetical protein
MWIASSLKAEPRQFSFGSSGQGPHMDAALVADGLELVNMVGAANWDEDPVQVVVCDCCGCVQCASGGWVSLRRLGDWVMMTAPTKGYVSVPDQFTRDQFAAPKFLRTRGAPLVPVALWDGLEMEGASLPSSVAIPPLSWQEVMLAAQMEAPRRLLGEPGEARKQPLSTVVTATDPWIEPALLDGVGGLTAWAAAPNSRVEMLHADETELVTLILGEELQEEVLVGLSRGAVGLYFKPGLVLFPAA